METHRLIWELPFDEIEALPPYIEPPKTPVDSGKEEEDIPTILESPLGPMPKRPPIDPRYLPEIPVYRDA